MIPKLVIANWKMAIDRESVRHFRNEWEEKQASCEVKVLIAPPAIFLSDLHGMAGVALCGQDVSANEPGAHTGELSAQMLDDFGCSHGLVGHSERRSSWNESDALVAKKAQRLELLQLCPVICVGESKADRESGKAEKVVAEQVLASCALLKSPPVIAYEPVWAIGSGEAATPEIAEAMHAAIKASLGARFGKPVPVLYGGSVNERNASQFTSCDSIDGLLVGGASLKAGTFLNICQSVGSKG
jgi:triosephosphate isomerase